MAEVCERHRGCDSEAGPYLDGIMSKLLESQSGAGRHKCAYCAYEKGMQAGREHEKDRLARFMNVSIDELEHDLSKFERALSSP